MRVGIIGCGDISYMHFSALAELNQNVVAICDVVPSKCNWAIEHFNLSCNVYTDYVQMLNNEKLDVIHICTPHYLHAPMIIEGLSRNINVLCEKPVAISYQQLEDIQKAVDSSKAQLGVCFQNRFNPSVQYVKNRIKGKKVLGGSFNIAWDRGVDYYTKDAWRGTREQEGGGVMINQAIHGLDIMQWMCGMPDSVFAYTHNNRLQGIIDVEDTAFGIFKYNDGRNFVVQATNTASFTFPVYYAFRTEEDTIELSEDNLIINGKSFIVESPTSSGGKVEWGSGHSTLIANYYNCLETNTKFSVDFSEAKKAIKLILAMYQSFGKEIEIK